MAKTVSRKNTLLGAALKAGKFKAVAEETNVSDLGDQEKSRIIMMTDDMLVDDPNNEEVYGEIRNDDIKDLTASMKRYGFLGIISAYPIESGKYMIESGHRRRMAAKLAGIKEYPVYVTDAPESGWEKDLRLYMANLHSRKETPMITARVCQKLFEAHQKELNAKRENLELRKGDSLKAVDYVSQDLELSPAVVNKYKALLKLIPKLQELADSETVSWSALSAASTLTEEQQYSLAYYIENDLKNGQEVKRDTILSYISSIKLGGEPQKRKEKVKDFCKIYKAKDINKPYETLKEILVGDLRIEDKDKEDFTNKLQYMKQLIEITLDSLKN